MEEQLIINENEEELNDDEIRPISAPTSALTKFRLTVEPTIGVIYMTQTLSDSVLTELYLKRTCQVMLEYNSTICDALGSNTEAGHAAESLVQPAAAELLMWKLVLRSAVPAFLSFFLGPWSDSNGRMPIIIFSVAGTALMHSFYTVMAYIPNLHPAFLLLGVLPLAFLGGYVNLTSAVCCYVADTSTSETRSHRLALLTGIILIGTLAGLVISPYLFAAGEKYELGYFAIFGTCALLSILVLIRDVFFVKETINVAQDASGFRGILDISHPIAMMKTCFKWRDSGRRTILLLGTYCLAIHVFVTEGESQVTFIFTRFQFRWSLEHFMNYSSAAMAVIIVGTMFGPRLLINYMKMKEPIVAAVAISINTVQAALVGFANAQQEYLLYISVAIGPLHTLNNPLLRSIMSKSVPAEDVGKVFALVGSFEALVPIASATVYVGVYNHFVNGFPGAPFILSAISYATAAAAVIVLAYIHKPDRDNTVTIGGNEE